MAVAPQTPGQFSRGAPSFQDALLQGARGTNQQLQGVTGDIGALSRRGGFQSLGQIGGAGKTAVPFGLATLTQILGRQGQTDPRLFNQQIASNARQTQDLQTAAGARFAGGPGHLGAAGSGLNAALQAAIGSGGAGRDAQIRANEAAQAENRSRTDLQLLQDIILGPQFDALALERGQALGNRQLSNQRTANLLGGIGTFTGGLGQLGFGQKNEG